MGRRKRKRRMVLLKDIGQNIKRIIMASYAHDSIFYILFPPEHLHINLSPRTEPLRHSRYPHNAICSHQRHEHARPPAYGSGDKVLADPAKFHPEEFLLPKRRGDLP